ncbi:MAG: hypothetical protein ACJ798_15235 [Phenylobacterium sp.]
MTKQTRTRRRRQSLRVPAIEKLASVHVDRINERVVFTTKNMIQNQLKRDGPRIRRSFDELTRSHISVCSELFGQTAGLVFRHLPNLQDDGFKATVSRLLNTALNTYLASIEVARHGYRRQYGMLARSLIEAIATVITIAVKPTALKEFHAGKLRSTKCVSCAKDFVAPLGKYYGMLSDHFVHVGPAHAALEPVSPYVPEDEALKFIISSLRGDVWLLYLAAELVLHDEIAAPRYWKSADGGVSFQPSEDERRWMAAFLIGPEEIG